MEARKAARRRTTKVWLDPSHHLNAHPSIRQACQSRPPDPENHVEGRDGKQHPQRTAFAGTALSRHIKPQSRKADVARSGAAVLPAAGPQWESVSIPLPEVGAFNYFKGRMSLEDDVEALNVQLLLKSDGGEQVWGTLFSGKAAAGELTLRLTWRSLDQRALTKMSGSGSVVVRCKTGNAQQAKIHIRNAQLLA